MRGASCSLLRRGSFNVGILTRHFVACRAMTRLRGIMRRLQASCPSRQILRVKKKDGLLFLSSFSKIILRSQVKNVRIRASNHRIHIGMNTTMI